MSTTKKRVRKSSENEEAGEANENEIPTAKKNKIVNSDVDIFERDTVRPKVLPPGRYCKIVSWNVNGLRAVLRNHPQLLNDLVKQQSPDVICLQETKIQHDHVKDLEDCIEGYRGYWLCSHEKKGYSGTAIFVKSTGNLSKKKSKPQQGTLLNLWNKSKDNSHESKSSEETDIKPSEHSNNESYTEDSIVNVVYDLEDSRFNGEGRTITIQFPKFYLVGCYVPNSGQDLKRLDFRINEWDPYIRSYIKKLNETKPVIFAGDLNVGHLDLDIYNFDAKHIVKQAGLTPQERASFSTLLSNGLTDVFRYFYPDARGQFTYWSARTRARASNKGLRLDYFVCTDDMLPAPAINSQSDEQLSNVDNSSLLQTTTCDNKAVVVDSYILYDFAINCSDHCPIALIVKI